MDKDTMLHFLKISGLLVIASVFTLNGPLLTLTLTLFVIAVVLNCLRIFGGTAGISDQFDFSIDKWLILNHNGRHMYFTLSTS